MIKAAKAPSFWVNGPSSKLPTMPDSGKIEVTNITNGSHDQHSKIPFQEIFMISIVIPLLNEEGNLKLLHQKLTAALTPLNQPYEIIFINDGSTDNSPQVLDSLFEQDPVVRVIHFHQNFGKTAALVAGFRHSRGDIIITMDADLQDDPAEIPKMVAKLQQGYDLVAAWRHDRQDPLDKTWPSKIFNGVVSTFSGLHLHDFNCGFKVYRRTVTEQIPLYS
ncbi:MAG: glycosyltransferase family 2 protein, partial [Anaerolineae bacterium]|nr:glycosyltransferase family 2 protein [Anaerolineae bacterium]